MCDRLTSGTQALKATTAHAFLGRILFTCYLCHRGIISLGNYLGKNTSADIRELLAGSSPEKAHSLLYGKLFPALRSRFNGSMFDEDLSAEKEAIKPSHLEVIHHFLDGSEIKKGQRSLGFWAYRFDFIPVETISSIYEKFLEKEDGESKRKLGAYYTPRLLAEMTLDLALRGRTSVQGLRFIDPSCGSGIFLVLAFNRLVADWNLRQKKSSSVAKRAEALFKILSQLRGVDKHPTACRISCFSLYLAFLDQFEPSDVEAYIDQTKNKLPNLLVADKAKPHTVPVIWHRDFLRVADEWKGDFDVVIGNPPWEGRGTKQLANRFMEKAPGLLKQNSRASLILPSKIFLNQTDEFQSRWLRSITLETMVQLADYRFILFKEAICPASIVCFHSGKPDANHQIEYIAPKVTRTDLRDGQIPVAPQDRKWIPLARPLEAGKTGTMGTEWKTRLWGTPRDQKLLDYLFTLPRLEALVGTPNQQRKGLKRWAKGQGFQPKQAKLNESEQRRPSLSDNERFVTPDLIGGLYYLPFDLTHVLNKYLESNGYRLDEFHRSRDEMLFQAPMVLLNQGFTKVAFFDYPVRFQAAFQAFVGKEADSSLLQLLAFCLKSKLYRYFAFHTSANIGTERDKGHLSEVLRFPFQLPDDKTAPDDALEIVTKIAELADLYRKDCQTSAKALLKKLGNPSAGFGPLFGDGEDGNASEHLKKWIAAEEEKSRKLREQIDPLIYRYFNLTAQDIALVEDTCEIFDKGDTPPSLEAARRIPTLAPIHQWNGLQPYADMICQTLNGWATGKMRVTATGAVDTETGLALVELRQSKSAKPFSALKGNSKVIEAAARLQDASKESVGQTMAFHRNGWIFDGTRILIVKPARLGEWTATSAINDAAALYVEISETGRLKNK